MSIAQNVERCSKTQNIWRNTWTFTENWNHLCVILVEFHSLVVNFSPNTLPDIRIKPLYVLIAKTYTKIVYPLSVTWEICIKVFHSTLQVIFHIFSQFALEMKNLSNYFFTARSLSCTICKENCGNLDNLREHVKIHYSTNTFECGHCGKIFKRKTNMRQHILKVHRG